GSAAGRPAGEPSFAQRRQRLIAEHLPKPLGIKRVVSDLARATRSVLAEFPTSPWNSVRPRDSYSEVPATSRSSRRTFRRLLFALASQPPAAPRRRSSCAGISPELRRPRPFSESH